MKAERSSGSYFMWMLCGLLLSLAVCSSALAQTGASSVRGTILDQQGKAVVGANVTLTNSEKNFTRTQVTNEGGVYTFNAIPPGTYRVEAEATGFKKSVVNDVRALVETPTEVDVQLEAGNISEVVNVTADSEAPLNTTDATIGNAFEARRIEQLPLNARNVVGLLSLQPGVTRTGYVNGGRSDQSNITLDGVDVNEQQSGLDIVTDEAFASVLRSTPDSLQEFRVTTTNPNAEQGRSSGAQVSLVTKSGTNEFHGSLYEFTRNTITTANDFFNNKAGRYTAQDPPVQLGLNKVGDPRVPRPQLIRNIFGGSVGGPIKSDRAFFFFTYEGLREASETPVVREVPLPTLGQGIVRYQTESGTSDPNCPPGTPAGVRCLSIGQINDAYIRANGVSPGINPLALATLADAARRYPANDNTVGDGLNTGGFRFNAKTPAELNTYIAKFDFNLTDRQTLFVRGNYQQDNVTRATYGGPDCLEFSSTDNIQCLPDTPPLLLWNHPLGIAAGHSWTITNNIINRFTYGFTRAAFTQAGSSQQNSVSFRFIFSPSGFKRDLRRTTPVHNFIDDVSWIKGNHTYQFGGNIRLVRNNRTGLGASFDEAVVNPSFYDGSGRSLLPVDEEGDPVFPDAANDRDLRDALAAVIGRFSQYSASLNYAGSGDLLPIGSPGVRSFATEEYEAYWQDSWRIRPNFTLSYGIRWSTSTPVYERNGVQVKPTQSLGEYFQLRAASANDGVPFTAPITLDLAGKANNRDGYYKQDWNNFAPSIAFAWSPDLGDNFLGRLLGRNGKSVLRGGFRMTYDRIGSQLAVNFDLNSVLGFSSTQTVAANTFNVSDRPGPLFTGANPSVRDLPGIAGNFDTQLIFPLVVASDEDQRIEQSLDDTLKTPYNYSVNLSYGRELWKGLSLEVSYVGRFGRKLLATRDIMHLNNIRDPQSGQTWYEAINLLTDLRYANAPVNSVGPIPFFENLMPFLPEFTGTAGFLTPTQTAYLHVAQTNVGGIPGPLLDQDFTGFGITDYTFLQLLWDDSPNCTTCPFGSGPSIHNNMFFHPQFAALSTFSTVARSNYNSAQLSLRQRFGSDVAFDFNYTYGHSLDNASGLQNSSAYASAAFILNPLFPDLNYADSDFDVRHSINANWVIGLPFGRGKAFMHDVGGFTDTLIGGWQVTGITRWNSGLPILTPFEGDRWATNWNVQSNGVRVRPLRTSPTRTGDPNVFSDPVAAYQSFRDPRAGEAGDRNVLRGPGYFTLDMGLYKTFKLPWEGHTLQFRWEVFNVTNTQRFDGNTLADLGFDQDPFLTGAQPNPDFGRFTSTQAPLNENKAGRVMQFALRYQF
ncbi:MAG: carboxypeptidase-like regulatory domain-containing protein [Pyrinomonadaceae bacterium]